MNTTGKGNYGEALAINFLQKEGYKILQKNYSTKMGEIDIICQKDNYTVFVEVKYRENVSHGFPIEAVSTKKRLRYVKAASLYLMQHGLYESDVRFDVIDILGTDIVHIVNAFDSSH